MEERRTDREQPGAQAVLLSASLDSASAWTADGRRHPDVPGLTLTGIRQLRAARTSSAPRRPAYPALRRSGRAA